MAPMPQNRLRMPPDVETANPNTALSGLAVVIFFLSAGDLCDSYPFELRLKPLRIVAFVNKGNRTEYAEVGCAFGFLS